MTRKYGCMTVERHEQIRQQGTFVKVLLDGVEVTHRCVMADDKVGRVLLLCEDPEHRDWKRNVAPHHVVPDAGDEGVCKLSVLGDVDMVP